MVRLMRWLQGYVCFEGKDGFTERFLNLCNTQGVNLWGVENDGVKLVAFTTAREFKLINQPAEKSGMEIKILKSVGMPFFIQRYKWRCGVIFGCFAVVLFIFLMSQFIWEVEIVADGSVKIDGFTEYVEKIGVKIGAKKEAINIPEVQEKLLDNFPELSWVSLNIFGTKAQIEYIYATPQQPIADTKTFTNVVASKDGEVTHIEGYAGTNMVKVGANVPKGSLLISGVITNADMTESFVHAKGKVLARTNNFFEKECQISCRSKIVSQTSSVYSFYFFGVEVPLGRQKAASTAETELLVKGNDTALPLGFLRTDGMFFEECECKPTKNQSKLWSLLECVEYTRENFLDAEMESIEYFFEERKNEASVSVKIRCIENIAYELPGSVEEN